jgi:hypothetical protein
MHSQGRTQLLLGVLSTVNTYMASKYEVIKQGFPKLSSSTWTEKQVAGQHTSTRTTDNKNN